MNKVLLTLIGLIILVVLVLNDTCRITLSTSNYTISMSFILCIICLFVLLWFFSLLKKPIEWWQQIQNHKARKRQQKVSEYLSEVLTAFLGHHAELNSKLIHKAKQLYGADSKEFLLVSALLQPQPDVFKSLNSTEADTTKLVGLYGLIQEAEATGNFEQMADLLQQVPKTLANTPWVQHTKMRLALNQNDWSEALRLLNQAKPYLTKHKYRAQKACLLLKMGKIKEAYAADNTHPAVALAYAKFNPRKALKVLKKAWDVTPGWPIYQAFKNAVKTLPEKKQLKALLDLTRATRDNRASLLARADMDMDLQNWARAKENLEIYIRKYPLTRQVATMMATIERSGWHHEQAALGWERKAVEAEDDSLWLCQNCNHAANEWQILCPHCNAFDALYLK